MDEQRTPNPPVEGSTPSASASDTRRVAAEYFPPGEFIQEELAERGWSDSDLAALMAVDRDDVVALLVGTIEITPEIAARLSSALGTSTEFWMNLERLYRQWRETASARESISDIDVGK